MVNEWKIDTWFMKTLFVLASIAGVAISIGMVIGFISGVIG